MPIKLSRSKARLLYSNSQCYARTSGGGGVPPQSITFTRGKARLLYINFYCYARISGAAAHGAGFLRPPPRPLRCALRLLHKNLQVLFSIKLCRTGKLPESITFTRGKARLLYINFYCYARTSGAAARRRRFSTFAATPLAVRFTAIVLKFFNFFFYQALPHLIPHTKLAARG